jgi:hypothetical protein
MPRAAMGVQQQGLHRTPTQALDLGYPVTCGGRNESLIRSTLYQNRCFGSRQTETLKRSLFRFLGLIPHLLIRDHVRVTHQISIQTNQS